MNNHIINLENLPEYNKLFETFQKKIDHEETNIHFSIDYKIQYRLNIPILFLTALHIGSLCKKYKFNKVLFCSRDCFYLTKIFKILFDDSIESEYFYTSRISRTSATHSYRDYAISHINEKTLIVDLCGTGNSLGHLYSKIEMQPWTFFLHLIEPICENKSNKINKYTSNKVKNLLFLIKGQTFSNIFIELSNYSLSEMLIDVKYKNNSKVFEPLFRKNKYPKKIESRIKNIDYIINIFLIHLKTINKNTLIREQNQNVIQIELLIKNLYTDLSKQEKEFSDFFSYHFKNEEIISAQLDKNYYQTKY
jgi:hypothetical protein